MKRASRVARLLVCVFMLFDLMSSPTRAADSDGTLVFGFLPFLSTERLVTRFEPLVDEIAAELGQPIRMETAPDFSVFLARTQKKRYDILFTAPHFYYLANKQSHYRAIVRVNADDLKGIIAANKGSHITRVSELRGKRIAMPDPLSLAAALADDYLNKAGLHPGINITIVRTPSLNAALVTAYDGIADAACLMLPPYKHAPEKIRSGMVVLAVTESVPHMPIAVSPTLSPAVVKKLTKILVSLDQTSKGKALLKKLGWPEGFIRTDNSEYASLGKIVSEMHLE